ncbi:hypothetical protein [Mycolicibacter minnesotensis]
MSELALWVFGLCLVAGFALPFLKIGRHAERRWYWGLVCIAGTAGVLSTYPTWNRAAALGFAPVASMVVLAYVSTPYIKIGGKIYALTITDPDPEDAPASSGDSTSDSTQQEVDPHPDSYSGLLTAPTMWWLFVALTSINTANIYFAAVGRGEVWVGLLSGALFVLVTAPTAYGDASWRYPIARGQYIQFAVASVITAGVFPLLYLTTYYIAQRHPLRRKQSMEYRVHPRHRKWED